jgi:hypothetical protein
MGWELRRYTVRATNTRTATPREYTELYLQLQHLFWDGCISGWRQGTGPGAARTEPGEEDLRDQENASLIPGEAGLRWAQSGDVENIVRLINAAFVVERFFLERDRVNAEKVRMMMVTGKFLLAEDAAGLVGCVYVELRGPVAMRGCSLWIPSASGQASGAD